MVGGRQRVLMVLPARLNLGVGGMPRPLGRMWGAAANGKYDEGNKDFVDVEDDFAGQGLCNPLSTLLNPPMPDLSFPTGFSPASLHPTAAGQAAYAAAIMAAGFDS